MSSSYDAIVIGAGHNGLTTAAYLAKHGRSVVVLEGRDVAGGLAGRDAFHPGYESAGLLHDTGAVRAHVVRELELERHGLKMREAPAHVLALGAPGKALLLGGTHEQAAAALRQQSSRDADRYLEFRAFIDAVRDVLRAFLDEPPVDPTDVESMRGWDLLRRGLRVRRLGRGTMLELLRTPPMCVADWLDEWFADDLLKAALALPAVAGTFLGPRSPGSNANLLFHEAAAGPGVAGDGPMLITALVGAVESAGGEIRTQSRVTRLVTESGAVVGAQLADGDALRAPIVAASCDPKQVFLDLLPAGSFGYRLQHRIQSFRTRGTTAQVLFALSQPLRWKALPENAVEFVRIAGGLDEIERAFDAVKYHRFAEQPVLEVHAPAASATAPPGHAVVSVLVHFAPYDLHPGWDDEQREHLGRRVEDILSVHALDLPSAVVARTVLSPVDLETRYGTSGGHIHHGEHGLDQRLIRPAPGCTGSRTPLPGLYLCGSGSHPGGGLSCVPGALAAAAILRSA